MRSLLLALPSLTRRMGLGRSSHILAPWPQNRSSCRPARAIASATSSSSRAADTPRFNLGYIEIAAGRISRSTSTTRRTTPSCILEGEMTFAFAGREVVAGPGTFVLVPPGVRARVHEPWRDTGAHAQRARAGPGSTSGSRQARSRPFAAYAPAGGARSAKVLQPRVFAAHAPARRVRAANGPFPLLLPSAVAAGVHSPLDWRPADHSTRIVFVSRRAHGARSARGASSSGASCVVTRLGRKPAPVISSSTARDHGPGVGPPQVQRDVAGEHQPGRDARAAVQAPGASWRRRRARCGRGRGAARARRDSSSDERRGRPAPQLRRRDRGRSPRRSACARTCGRRVDDVDVARPEGPRDLPRVEGTLGLNTAAAAARPR